MAKKEPIDLLTLEEATQHLKMKHTGYLKQLAYDNYIGFVQIENKMYFTPDMINNFIHANSTYPKYSPKRIEDIFDYLSLKEVSELLKVSPRIIRKYISEGRFPDCFSIARKIFIPRSNVHSFLIDCKNILGKRKYYDK